MISAQLLTARLDSPELMRLDAARWRWMCAEAVTSIQMLHSGSSVSMATKKMGRSTSKNPNQSKSKLNESTCTTN